MAGLRAAAELLEKSGEETEATEFRREADRFLDAITRSLSVVAVRLGRSGMPASPYRRMDAGAIGSLAAGYPLALLAPNDPRLVDTVNYILTECFVDGGFFLDMVHSGINPYLTLHIAQVLLRAGDLRCLELIQTVAELASPTGQWPEAIHPRTGGGCMGDGHHVWASAEWVLMMRNSFVREEADRLILASGVQPLWLEQPDEIAFGPTLTRFGEVTIFLAPGKGQVDVRWEAVWSGRRPIIEVCVPGFVPAVAAPEQIAVTLARLAAA